MRERANCHPVFESYDRSGDRKSQNKPRLGRRACLASVKQTHPRRGLLISQNRSSIEFDPRSREALSCEWYRIAVRRVRWLMAISFARHQFSLAVIRHAVWLHTASCTAIATSRICSLSVVWMWVSKFGPVQISKIDIRRNRAGPDTRLGKRRSDRFARFRQSIANLV
jgi:hypothetical protein